MAQRELGNPSAFRKEPRAWQDNDALNVVMAKLRECRLELHRLRHLAEHRLNLQAPCDALSGLECRAAGFHHSRIDQITDPLQLRDRIEEKLGKLLRCL